jgi:hypothetical protein
MSRSCQNSCSSPFRDPFPGLTESTAVLILRRVLIQALLDMRCLMRRKMTGSIRPMRSLPDKMTPAEQRLLLAFFPSKTFARLCLNVLGMDAAFVRSHLMTVRLPRARRRKRRRRSASGSLSLGFPPRERRG